MVEPRHFCTHCGAELEPGVQFCHNCGKPVTDRARETVQIPRRASLPPQPASPPRRRFPWGWTVLGIGCLGVLCLGVVGTGIGGFVLFNGQTPTPQTVVVTGQPQPTVPPAPTAAQSSTASGPTLTGNQRQNEYSLFDDFSSDALGWPIYDDGRAIMKYEDNAYSIQITEPGYFDWAYAPVDFIPYEIQFEAHSQAGVKDGTYGVFCQFQDEDNYYYVEFDQSKSSYIVAEIVNGKDIPLNTTASGEVEWEASGLIKSTPTDVNRIWVSCYLDNIILFINDKMAANVKVKQPFSQPGEMALFVYTLESAGKDGYKVFFDNIEIWQPVQ
jgi:hypothetical protein